jgi:methylglyoxal synthase
MDKLFTNVAHSLFAVIHEPTIIALLQLAVLLHIPPKIAELQDEAVLQQPPPTVE